MEYVKEEEALVFLDLQIKIPTFWKKKNLLSKQKMNSK